MTGRDLRVPAALLDLEPDPSGALEIELEPERYEFFEPGGTPFTFDRRAFLRGLGGGLVVLCLLDREPEAQAQPPRGGGRRGGPGQGQGAAPREISAWLHIAEDGSVTAYTGKVEVGQNARTSLAQAVADELRMAPGSVRMVMGDTERCPFDMGTFGSRTTPSMSIQLRRASASARERLATLAAEEWKIDRARVEIAGGKALDRDTGRAVGIGTLTHGKDILQAIGESAATTPPSAWKSAGRSEPKAEGLAFVTGKHRYASDVARPGMLHGKILRPPAFGAELLAVDLSAAQSRPGVAVVREGAFVGVAAPTELAATEALAALKPEWGPAKASCSDRTLYDHLKQHAGRGGAGPGAGGGRGGGGGGGERGSVAEGLASADAKLERTYNVAYIAHAPLEPRSAVAEWEGDRLTVWTGTSRPFGVRGELAQAFGIPETKVHVIVPDTGAGYGGKHTGEAAIEAARLAKAAGKPVKRVWTREEEFTWAYFRPAGVIEASAAARKDGTLTAWAFRNINSGNSGAEIPYEVANRRVGFVNSDAPLRQGSYRALASTANHFARESLIDELAREIGMDPLAFRLKNLNDARLRAVFEAAASRFGWGQGARRDGRGVGIAGGTEKGGFVASCAEVAVSGESVKVTRIVTAFECGAIVNPDHLKNQVEGATVMGLGGALFEAMRFDGGRILNPRFSRYRVPRFGDTPPIDVVLLDRKDLPPAGAGEAPIVGIAPAIASAIFDACGQRIRSLPLVPDGLKT
jgi:isoquinoline 1-oxidoreductase